MSDAPISRPGRGRPRTKRNLADVTPEEMEKLLLTADQLGCICLAKEYSKEHAAVTLGWSLDDVEKTLELPGAKQLLLDAHNAFVQDYAQGRLRNMRKVNVTAATVEERMMQLAMMDPRETKGTIDGQVKALQALMKSLGMFTEDDPLKNKSRTELEGFVTKAAKRLPMPPDDPPVN